MEEEDKSSEKRPKSDEQARDDTGAKEYIIRGESADILKKIPSCRVGKTSGKLSALNLIFTKTVTIVNGDKADLFLQDGWRQHLCSCDNVSCASQRKRMLIRHGQCTKLLSKHDVQYLVKEEDTYEPESDKDTGNSGMGSMNT